MKYNQWLQKWLELYVKPVAKPQTYIKYESAVRLHISPALGGYDINDLKADVLQRFVVDMTDTLSASTVNCIKKILSALIAIETVVLIAMLAVTYLSAAGNETATIFILAKAISTKVSLFGVSVSSLMLIQAIVVIFACVIFIYSVFRIVKEVCKSNDKIASNVPNDDTILLNPVQYITRKVFMLYCRMNN